MSKMGGLGGTWDGGLFFWGPPQTVLPKQAPFTTAMIKRIIQTPGAFGLSGPVWGARK
ncbi:MAG: hypothetical protein CM1200mP4_2630 [Rhodospirillaceae bacterium]|nr:MAG: hypothetical protein CM1200mP4_2630 [Rhodospirillaceae bacterium]